MSKLKVLFLFLMVYGISQLANAQEKYAVLITGDYAATGIPTNEQWNQGQDRGGNGFDEFWNDTFLMWEMLQEKGYSPENIYVLFADGNDYLSDAQAKWRKNQKSLNWGKRKIKDEMNKLCNFM